MNLVSNFRKLLNNQKYSHCINIPGFVFHYKGNYKENKIMIFLIHQLDPKYYKKETFLSFFDWSKISCRKIAHR